jgi:hypothetical protein
MTRVLRSAALLLLALLTATSAAAQTPATADDTFALQRLDGIQSAVSRTYTFDISSLADRVTTPNANLEMPSGTVIAIGIIAEFDTPEHAAAAVSAIGDASFAGREEQGISLELESSPVDDLGDGGIRHSGSGAMSEGEEGISTYVIQDGNWLYIAIVSSNDETRDATARGLIEFALEHDVSPDEPLFRSDGTSEGGLWDKLPSADDTQADDEDNVLAGITPMIDTMVFPDDDSTPTA